MLRLTSDEIQVRENCLARAIEICKNGDGGLPLPASTVINAAQQFLEFVSGTTVDKPSGESIYTGPTPVPSHA